MPALAQCAGSRSASIASSSTCSTSGRGVEARLATALAASAAAAHAAARQRRLGPGGRPSSVAAAAASSNNSSNEQPDALYELIARNQSVVRAAPIWAGAAGFAALLANRALSGVAPVVDAGSGQSRADVLGILMSAALLLSGLQWLSLRGREPEAVPLDGPRVEWVDPSARLPPAAERELRWAWRALSATARCSSLALFLRGRCVALFGVAAPAAAAAPGAAAVPGPVVSEAVSKGKGQYLANLVLYPGRGEFVAYLPEATQGVAVQPFGGGFSGEAFERLRHYSTLKADGGALVINAHGILAVWVGGARDPNPFKRYKAWGGCVRGGAVMHEQLPDLVERVKAAAQNIVRLMLKEVDRRFPKCRTVGALAIGDLSYWHGIKASGEDHSHLEHAAHTIAAAFRTRDSPRFDLDLLIAQAPAFHDKLTTYSAHFLHSPAEERLALGGAESLSFDAAAEEASKEYPATATDKLWKVISELPDVSIDCSEWLKWVRLTYAVVLGTNDNERAHSRMKLLRTALRSGLRLEHLVNALRVVLHPKEIGPRRAFALWVVGRREVGERQVGQKRARDV